MKTALQQYVLKLTTVSTCELIYYLIRLRIAAQQIRGPEGAMS